MCLLPGSTGAKSRRVRRVTWSTEALAGGWLVHASMVGFGLVQPQVNISRELSMKTAKLPVLVLPWHWSVQNWGLFERFIFYGSLVDDARCWRGEVWASKGDWRKGETGRGPPHFESHSCVPKGPSQPGSKIEEVTGLWCHPRHRRNLFLFVQRFVQPFGAAILWWRASLCSPSTLLTRGRPRGLCWSNCSCFHSWCFCKQWTGNPRGRLCEHSCDSSPAFPRLQRASSEASGTFCI